MHSLVLKVFPAQPDLADGVDAIASSLQRSFGVHDVAMIVAAMMLFMALNLIRLTFRPLKEVIRALLAAGAAAVLMLTAFVLVLISGFRR